MKIGIVSDTHGRLPEEVARGLRGVDHILFAGDAEDPATLMDLSAIADTIAVQGNNDFGAAFHDPTLCSPTAAPLLGGVRFYMAHTPRDVAFPPAGTEVVVHGHTHVPRDENLGGIRYLNPGSTGRPRSGSKPGYMIATVENGMMVRVDRIDL